MPPKVNLDIFSGIPMVAAPAISTTPPSDDPPPPARPRSSPIGSPHDSPSRRSPYERGGRNPKSSLSPPREKMRASHVQFDLDGSSLDSIQRVESMISDPRRGGGEQLDDLFHCYSLSDLPVVESFVCSRGTTDQDTLGSMVVAKGPGKKLGRAGQSYHSAVLITVFVWIETRWTAWGARPISFHDFVTSEQRHNLVRLAPGYTSSRCSACGATVAMWGCPPREVRLECPERQFACQACYSQGFTFHVGLLEGEHREYKLTALKQLFEQADTTSCGALDFLEYMFFTFSLVYIRRNWGDFRPDKELQSIWDEMTKMKEVYVRWADAENGLDLSALQKLLDEIDFPIPSTIEDLFKQRATPAGRLSFRGFIEVLYTMLRPDSDFINPQPKMRLPRPQISARPRMHSLCPPDLDHFDHRLAKQQKLLGEGGSSFAWLIHYTNYQMCAKCPKPNVSKREISDMMEAARLQRLVHHENVLRVLGIHQASSWPCILLELAQGGDVSMWQVYDVERAVQLRVLKEVARGINALHTNTPTIIHRDIKGRNILLTSDLTAKVADFDFAVVVRNPTAKTSGVCGTPGYMAPEVLMDKEYWTAVDVFSFGSLMYEVTHKRHPFSLEVERPVDEIRKPVDFANRCAQLTKDGVRPKLDPAHCPSKMRTLIRDCWAHDPAERPPMAKVIERLEAMDHQFTEGYKLPDRGDDGPAPTGPWAALCALAADLPGLNRLTRIDLLLLSVIVILLAVVVARWR